MEASLLNPRPLAMGDAAEGRKDTSSFFEKHSLLAQPSRKRSPLREKHAHPCGEVPISSLASASSALDKVEQKLYPGRRETDEPGRWLWSRLSVSPICQGLPGSSRLVTLSISTKKRNIGLRQAKQLLSRSNY